MKRAVLFASLVLGLATAGLAISSAANAGVVTIDITGQGSGSLGGTTFSNAQFNFHLVGPDGQNDVVALNNQSFVQITGFSQVGFTNPMEIGLSTLPSTFAFLRQVGGSDLLHLTFSLADFTSLHDDNGNLPFGPFNATATTFGSIATTPVGPLVFNDEFFQNVQLAGISSAVPELSTWVMMLMGFAGLGLLRYRRARKTPAKIALV